VQTDGGHCFPFSALDVASIITTTNTGAEISMYKNATYLILVSPILCCAGTKIGQPVLTGTPCYELDDYAGAKF